MRDRGETRRTSAWTRARKLGRDAPKTTVAPTLRALCMQWEKAVSVITERGRDRAVAHFGTPADAESWVAWRVDAISIYLTGDLPETLDLRLGDAADVLADVTWDRDTRADYP